MRFLSIVWYKVLPAKFGGQKNIAFFNKALANHYPLVCLCSRNNEPATNISYTVKPQLPLSKLQFFSPLVWLKIINSARKERATHIILEHPYHGIAGYLTKTFTAARLIVQAHNIEYLRFKNQNKWWWPLLKGYERWTHRQADLNFFKTPKDLATAVKHFGLAAGKCLVVPYGVEKRDTLPKRVDAYNAICIKHSLPEGTTLLFFAGTLDYEPNAEAVVAIATIIIPLLREKNFSFRVLVCGRNNYPSFQYLKKLQAEELIYVGEVENVDLYFRAATVFISPVLQGNGVQTKVMDALSYNLNVVAFEHVLEGIDQKTCSLKIFSAPDKDWACFTEQIVEAVSKKGQIPESFYSTFDWNTIIQNMLKQMPG